MNLTEQEILQILELVDHSDFGELRLETGELKLVVRKKGYTGGCGEAEVRSVAALEAPQPPAPAAHAAAAASGSAELARSGSDRAGTVAIPSPLLGTFYRRPSPDAPPYVEVGSFVREDDTVCIIEVMKVFTAVKAGVCGRLAEVLAENGALVEYGQPLFRVKPEAESPK